MAVAIEGNVTKWFDQEKMGMRIGIRLDSKGWKRMPMWKIMEWKSSVKGWTHKRKLDWYVKTNVKNKYICLFRFWLLISLIVASVWIWDRILPICWRVIFRKRVWWLFCAKVILPVISVVFADGKMPFMTSRKTFAASNAQLGAEWRAFKHLNVYADLTWGLNDIFQKDFWYNYFRHVSDLPERRFRLRLIQTYFDISLWLSWFIIMKWKAIIL